MKPQPFCVVHKIKIQKLYKCWFQWINTQTNRTHVVTITIVIVHIVATTTTFVNYFIYFNHRHTTLHRTGCVFVRDYGQIFSCVCVCVFTTKTSDDRILQNIKNKINKMCKAISWTIHFIFWTHRWKRNCCLNRNQQIKVVVWNREQIYFMFYMQSRHVMRFLR